MATSYNGWPASRDPKAIGIVPFTVFGESFPAGVKGGDVQVVFRYLCEQFHRRVEPLVRSDWHQADDWGYYYRPNVNNPSTLSCHSSGTAIDINATRHPNGRRGTFTAAQVREIREILSELGGVVRWGGDFTGTPDEMHFEIRGTAAQVAAVARRLTAQEAQTAVQPQPIPGPEDDMTEDDRKILREVHAMLTEIRAPRRPDRSDPDPMHISLADCYTISEKAYVEAKKAAEK